MKRTFLSLLLILGQPLAAKNSIDGAAPIANVSCEHVRELGICKTPEDLKDWFSYHTITEFSISLNMDGKKEIVALTKFSDDITAKILNDLRSLLSIQGSTATPLHKKFFGDGPLDGLSYLAYVMRVHDIFEYDASMVSSAPFLQAGIDRIYFGKSYFYSSFPLVVRLSALIHEAVHNDTSEADQLCPVPFLDEKGRDKITLYGKVKLEGLPACADKYDGPYGRQVVMLKNIEKYCESCDEKMRLEAGRFANELLERFISMEAKKALIDDFSK